MGIKNLEIRNAKYNLKQLKENHLKGKKQKFLFFWGHQPSKDGSITKTCFSQWWKSVFIENERKYCCMEQYMMAKKAELFEDDEILKEIMKTAERVYIILCKLIDEFSKFNALPFYLHKNFYTPTAILRK